MILIFENENGQALRTIAVSGHSVVLGTRRDTKRVEVCSEILVRDARNPRSRGFKRQYDNVVQLDRATLAVAPYVLRADGENDGHRIRLAEEREFTTITDLPDVAEKRHLWLGAVLLSGFLVFFGLLIATKIKVDPALNDKAVRTQLVQIIKRAPPPPPVVQAKVEPAPAKDVEPAVKKAVNVKRLGALSILGQLAKSQQKGGLDLAAVKTTTGVGLGGTAGSGGTQTSLYGHGLVAAPLGSGANLQGGGGYGTKGKGGGQAGYGKISLVGSSGSATIPLGKEAIVEAGLDRDLISGIIAQNMGQVRFCYEQGLQSDPTLAGRVAIAFVIGGNGQVKTTAVESSTLNSKQVEDCIALRLRSWRFPLPAGGVDVKVSYPFVLRRAGQA